jgi:hypothetical protein
VARRLRQLTRLSDALLEAGASAGPSAAAVAARLEEACSVSTLCLSLVAAGAARQGDGGGSLPE